MKHIFISSLFIIGVSFLMTACEGYRSINSVTQTENLKGIDVSDIHISSVEMANPEQKIGERRTAQVMAQELRRRFVGETQAPFQVTLVLSDEQRSLSSRRDASVSRWMYFLEGRATVHHKGEDIATIHSRADAPYFVEESPFATQANLQQAKEASARVLTRDMHRQLNILLHEYSQKEQPNKRAE